MLTGSTGSLPCIPACACPSLPSADIAILRHLQWAPSQPAGEAVFAPAACPPIALPLQLSTPNQQQGGRDVRPRKLCDSATEGLRMVATLDDPRHAEPCRPLPLPHVQIMTVLLYLSDVEEGGRNRVPAGGSRRAAADVATGASATGTAPSGCGWDTHTTRFPSSSWVMTTACTPVHDCFACAAAGQGALKPPQPCRSIPPSRFLIRTHRLPLLLCSTSRARETPSCSTASTPMVCAWLLCR